MVERDASILAPLAGFYAAAGRTPPVVEVVAAPDVPHALRDLLAAPQPLTPRLEDRHGETLVLRVLERRRTGDHYARRIVLVRGDGVPVVLGAIEMDLGRLAPDERTAVLAEATPFGHIVAGAVTTPDALLRLACDGDIAVVLAIPTGPGWLYGRRCTLADPSGAMVARVVEVLAPDPPPRVRNTGS